MSAHRQLRTWTYIETLPEHSLSRSGQLHARSLKTHIAVPASPGTMKTGSIGSIRDTHSKLAAVQEIKCKGGRVLGIVNVVGSSIARASDGGLYLHAGPDIAVVATKTFVSSLIAFILLGLHLGRMKDMSVADGRALIEALDTLPGLVSEILQQEDAVKTVAQQYSYIENVYFVGRNLGFGVAMEAALKLKEISYIHAEAYAASELKHGPLALISPTTPTVFVLPDDDLFEKNLSTIEEIRARKGPLLIVTNAQDEKLSRVRKLGNDCIQIPAICDSLAPIMMLLQLLAYHIALIRECDVDQPRNLAKSVTVE
jgi:glucosamine--fructose-6-phosphate aminotransferase (isomerizing)